MSGNGERRPRDDRYLRYRRLKIDRPHDYVLRVAMANGRLNTTDELMHSELSKVWRDIETDASVSAVVLTGMGDAFSAGGDFAMIENMMDDHNA